MDKRISSLYFKLLSCVIFVLALAFYTAIAYSAEVTLQWNSVPEADGYNIYYGSETRNYQPPENRLVFGKQKKYSSVSKRIKLKGKTDEM